MSKVIAVIHLSKTPPKTRKEWGNEINPVTKVFKSKKDYNRHDKSWKKECY